MTKHKHHEAITAWANGESIEWSFDGQEWKPLNNNEPRFDEMLKYRVKPRFEVFSPDEVIEDLRMYSEDAGYSHSDYADTMRRAAFLIAHLRDRAVQ